MAVVALLPSVLARPRVSEADIITKVGGYLARATSRWLDQYFASGTDSSCSDSPRPDHRRSRATLLTMV